MSKTVLVVEDNVDSQMLVYHLLSHLGYDATVVGTGEEALDLLSDHYFDAAVIDLALPKLNGWQLFSRIRHDSQHALMPCVAITAYDSAEVSRGARDAGFSAYFAKPFDTSDFQHRLRAILN
jgi:CheY-like chemotaxis protein